MIDSKMKRNFCSALSVNSKKSVKLEVSLLSSCSCLFVFVNLQNKIFGTETSPDNTFRELFLYVV